MEKKYIVYASDLKYKSLRNIDPKKAIWHTEEVKRSYYNDKHDTIEFRLNECEKNNFNCLDFAYLDLEKLDINLLKKWKHYKYLGDIKILCLNNNKIKKIDEELTIFKKLEILDISNNELEQLNYLPPKLIELSCIDNKIIDLPSHDNLLRLTISNNQLTSISNYPKLTHLHCDNNKIRMISSYDKLCYLICQNNKLISIGDLLNLTYLDCSDNKYLSKVSSMPKLIYLICNNTKINDCSKFPVIKSIEFGNSEIKKIPYIDTLEILLFKNNQNIVLSSKYKIQEHVCEHNNICLRF
jgi:Leucine-rich repeat (LRR) protein